jgi:hypothetical protein
MPTPLEVLHNTNGEIVAMLELVARQQSGPLQVTPRHISKLVEELKVSGKVAKSLASTREPEVASEIADYHHNLERLLNALPGLHERLLAERARLQHANEHVHAATGWAQSQKTIHRP